MNLFFVWPLVSVCSLDKFPFSFFLLFQFVYASLCMCECVYSSTFPNACSLLVSCLNQRRQMFASHAILLLTCDCACLCVCVCVWVLFDQRTCITLNSCKFYLWSATLMLRSLKEKRIGGFARAICRFICLTRVNGADTLLVCSTPKPFNFQCLLLPNRPRRWCRKFSLCLSIVLHH